MLTMYKQITIKTLHNQGEKNADIARQLGCHRNTVGNIIARAELIEKQTRAKESVYAALAHGSAPGELTRGPDFTRWVLDIAALEVNGLSDCSVRLEAVRKNPRAPITAVTIHLVAQGRRGLPRHPQRASPAKS